MSHAESPQELLPECHANARPSLWKHKAGERRLPGPPVCARAGQRGGCCSPPQIQMVVKGRLCFGDGPCHQPSPQLLQRCHPLWGCRELPKAQPPNPESSTATPQGRRTDPAFKASILMTQPAFPEFSPPQPILLLLRALPLPSLGPPLANYPLKRSYRWSKDGFGGGSLSLLGARHKLFA